MAPQLTTPQWVRMGILSAAVVCALISLLSAWWVVHAEFGDVSDTEKVKPFDEGAFDGGGADLGQEVVFTGLFALLGFVACVALLVFDVLPLVGKDLKPIFHLAGTGAAIVLGLGAVLYTLLVWPGEISDETSFFDEQSSQGSSQFGVSFPSSKVSFYGGLGWYLAIAGMIILPAAAFVQRMMQPGAAPLFGEPSETVPTLPAAPAHAPKPTMAPMVEKTKLRPILAKPISPARKK